MIREILFYLLSAILAIVVYFTMKFLAQCYRLRAFKGPFALPMVGNIYTKESLYFMRYLTRLRKVYGKVFTFFGLTKAYLVVCDPQVVRRILSDSKTFYKGKDYTYHFNVAFGEGLVTSNGEKHKKDKLIFNKFFMRSNLSKLMAKVNETTDEAIDTLLYDPVNKTKCHIEAFFARLSLRVFMQFAMGCDLSKDPSHEKYLCETVSAGSWAVGRVISLGVPMWKSIPWVKMISDIRDCVLLSFKSIVETRKTLIEELKNDAKAKNEEFTIPEEIDDCLTALIFANMTDKDMADHFTTLVSAGHDTTAYFSSYMCYLLAHHPDVQDKLVSEISLHFKGRTDVTADDLVHLKYLNLVMHETLRVYSVIPQLTRYSGEEVHIKEAGITIPKGVDIMMPLFLINRDPELWNQPAEFIPERFENKSGQFTSASDGFFPFGYGTRTCIGNTLAQMESSVFIIKLLGRYRLETDPTFKPSIYSGISLTTNNGINVVLRERESKI